jgi:single-strand DNA-binding protein
MASVNRVLLMGNLTRDPIVRATESGQQVCEMGMAVNRRYRTAQGEEREDVCFIDMETWGRTAENCGRYLRKGSLVYVEGRLRLDQWQDKNTGQNRSKLRVVVENIQFLDRKEPGQSQGPDEAFDDGGYQDQGGYQQRGGGYQQQGGGYQQRGGGYQQRGGGYQQQQGGGYQQQGGGYQQQGGGYQQQGAGYQQQGGGYQQQGGGYQQQQGGGYQQPPAAPPFPQREEASQAAAQTTPPPPAPAAAPEPKAQGAPADKELPSNTGDDKAPVDDMPF